MARWYWSWLPFGTLVACSGGAGGSEACRQHLEQIAAQLDAVSEAQARCQSESDPTARELICAQAKASLDSTRDSAKQAAEDMNNGE